MSGDNLSQGLDTQGLFRIAMDHTVAVGAYDSHIFPGIYLNCAIIA